jgi:hypothetical protein
MIVAQCSILLCLARVRSVAIEQHSSWRTNLYHRGIQQCMAYTRFRVNGRGQHQRSKSGAHFSADWHSALHYTRVLCRIEAHIVSNSSAAAREAVQVICAHALWLQLCCCARRAEVVTLAVVVEAQTAAAGGG